MAAPSQRQSHLQRRARTLSPPPPPRTEEQPQACSIRWSFDGGFFAKANTLQGAWLECRPRTEEQPQACSFKSELAWRLRHKGKHITCRCLIGVPAALTSTHLESASALHQQAAASLLDHLELVWQLRRKGKHTCRTW